MRLVRIILTGMSRQIVENMSVDKRRVRGTVSAKDRNNSCNTDIPIAAIINTKGKMGNRNLYSYPINGFVKQKNTVKLMHDAKSGRNFRFDFNSPSNTNIPTCR